MNNSQDFQVEDDLPALVQMVEDMNGADDLYRPTNYWQVYEDKLMPELRSVGLRDFRRRTGTVLESFSATDVARTKGEINLKRIRYLYNRFTHKIPMWERFLVGASKFLTAVLPIDDGQYNYDAENATNIAFEVSRNYAAKTGAKSAESIGVSKYGNPQDLFQIGGNDYTYSFFKFYIRYADSCRHIDYESVKTLIELSPGSGKQAEIIHKLHPDITLLLFDIPPQLYICQQYLAATFPGDVIPYEECRNLSSLDDLAPGKIYILGAWQMPLVKNAQADVFMSTASLQEMEPHVAENYLGLVNHAVKKVMLIQSREGKSVARRKGLPGVMNKTLFENYQNALTSFELLEKAPSICWTALRLSTSRGYDTTYWQSGS